MKKIVFICFFLIAAVKSYSQTPLNAFLEGTYQIENNSTKSNPIYTIGSSFSPASNTLSNMYGIGYSHTNAAFINSTDLGATLPNSGTWGMYIAATGTAKVFLSGTQGHGYFKGNLYAQDVHSRGSITVSGNLKRTSHHTGHLEGSYINVGNNSSKSNPIYTIGSSFNPTTSSLSNMYGVGFSHTNATFINSTDLGANLPNSGTWGMYIAATGTAKVFLSGTQGHGYFKGNLYSQDIIARGKVGIGTTTTGSHKLAVDGSIGAREIKVEATGWSDFVFENHYELRTLEEVEKHIAEKGHLPEIPSEADVIENGINLGEMNAKLLQKIEELTLYLIDQNKQLEQANQNIKELQKKVSALDRE